MSLQPVARSPWSPTTAVLPYNNNQVSPATDYGLRTTDSLRTFFAGWTMRHPSSLGDLTQDEWEYLQDKLDRFEKAWRQADAVDLNRFLPPSGDRLRVVALAEFIKTDLEIRWRKGQTPVLEEYLKQYPELAEDRPVLAQLVYEEFAVRNRHGD